MLRQFVWWWWYSSGNRCMFTRCNMLRRRFHNCSMSVKLILIKSFCLCFYNIALWNKFRMFLGIPKYYSVTNILLLTGLPSFDTLMINAKKSDATRYSASSNALVKLLKCVCVFSVLYWFSVFLCYVCSSVWASLPEIKWWNGMEWNNTRSDSELCTFELVLSPWDIFSYF